MEIALNRLLKNASINDLVVAVLWDLVKDNFYELKLDFFEEKLVKVLQRFLAERFHAVILKMVPVQIVEHLVKKFGEHAVIVPYFYEGFQTYFFRLSPKLN